MNSNTDSIRPRLIIAGLSGGSGKTLVSLGLCRAGVENSHKIKPFKKGPDYIDANWLSLAAVNPASNLDPFLLSQESILSLFIESGAGFDFSLIEGNRGLFDGKDVQGSCSTSELARILNCPVLLVADCTKVTRTMAAIILGCTQLEKDLNIAGVVLNRTAGDRHRNILRNSIENYTDVPVLGALPKIRKNPIPERHMGLVSDKEHSGQEHIFKELAQLMRDNLDVTRIFEIGKQAPHLSFSCLASIWPQKVVSFPITLGVARDAALCFYYQENLQALQAAGARLIEISLLDCEDWPDLDGLYLGGGFPETLAQSLSANEQARYKVHSLAEQGLPIYAECGGFMYLGRSLEFEGQNFPMSNVLPVNTVLHQKPQGHGYVQARVTTSNPFYPVDFCFSGHEFHYSQCLPQEGSSLSYGLKMERGCGMGGELDGLLYRNVFASYTHIHALGVPCWAENFVRAADIFKQHKYSGGCPDIRI